MKPLWKLVAKDCRRVTWYVALWTVVQVAKFSVGLTVLFGQILSSRSASRLVSVLEIASYAISALITVVVVQEDVVIGSTSFWMTRPISALRLLIAKVIGIALLGIALPLAVHLPWWLGFGFGAADLGRAAVELSTWQLLCVVPATMMAAITDTFTRFAVWTLVFVLAVFCTGTQIITALRGSDLTMSAMILQVGVLVVTALVVTGVVYLTGRLIASVALLIAGVAAGGYVGEHGPIDFISRTDEVKPAGEMNPDFGRDVRLIVREAKIERTERSDAVWRGVLLPIDFESLPAGLRLSSGYSRQLLTWPTGQTMSVGGRVEIPYDPEPLRLALGAAKTEPDPETQRWLQRWVQQPRNDREPLVLGALGRRRQRPGPAEARVILRRRILELAVERRPKWSMETELRLLRPVKRDEFDARAGESTHAAGFFRIKFVRRDHRLRNIPIGDKPSVREDNKILFGFRSGRAAPLWNIWSRRDWRDDVVVVFNAKSGEIIDSIRDTFRPVVVGGVGFVNTNTEFYEPLVRRGDRWVVSDPDLLEHMKVAVVRWEEVSRFKRNLEIEHLEIKPPELPVPTHD